MSMGRRWDGADIKKLKYWEENLTYCRFVELRRTRLKAGV
jgi:hypothetical protein